MPLVLYGIKIWILPWSSHSIRSIVFEPFLDYICKVRWGIICPENQHDRSPKRSPDISNNLFCVILYFCAVFLDFPCSFQVVKSSKNTRRHRKPQVPRARLEPPSRAPRCMGKEKLDMVQLIYLYTEVQFQLRIEREYLNTTVRYERLGDYKI
ncbi:hypothetical protein TNCV_2132201 [Trichonephila clavipes]|nr:hypothetical protein TNCV_2132201 [Trichonephila clavipes]